MTNRLLVAGDEQGFPVDLLSEPVEAAAHIDWRQRNARTLTDALQHVEQEWSKPTGMRRLLQEAVVFLGNWLPSVTLILSFIVVLWRWFHPLVSGVEGPSVPLSEFLMPFVVTLIVLVLLQILSNILLPLRWTKIRGDFRKELERRLRNDFIEAHVSIPAEVADSLREERRRLEQMQSETREVAVWLREREQAASIAGLYGRQ